MPKNAVLQHLIDVARKNISIKKVIFFGSRARKDSTDRSDYDFAIETVNMDHADWSRWALTVEENSPTLCKIDLIWLNSLENDKLRENIMRDGEVIYERK